MATVKRLKTADLHKRIILIRLIVGAVFLSEGIQKFLYADLRGAGRFAKIGLPAPEALGPSVGFFEVVCGILVLTGFLTRFAVVPLIVVMLVALATTKLPILINDGFWQMAHAGRTDYAMLLGSCFLLLVGAGSYSLDERIAQRRESSRG